MKKDDDFVQSLGSLEIIAIHLNRIPTMEKGMADIWKRAEHIITSLVDPPPLASEKRGTSLLANDPYKRKGGPIRLWAAAVMDFNEMAEENPVPLHIESLLFPDNKTEFITDEQPRDSAQFAVYLLWLDFFRGRGWERLKRCPQCGKWFVDGSRNRNKNRCSMDCTWKWWSRSKRKEAGHGRKRKKTAVKKRISPSSRKK
jgi:hypothetical protein